MVGYSYYPATFYLKKVIILGQLILIIIIYNDKEFGLIFDNYNYKSYNCSRHRNNINLKGVYI